MLASAKLYQGRNVVRFTLIAVSGIWLTGCSSDATRFTEAMNTPFSNPFASSPSTAQGNGAAPTPSVSSQPLASSGAAGGNVAYQAPAHPSPVSSAPVPAPAPVATGSIRAPSQTTVAGGPGGWTAVGGSPVLVIQGDTADSLARRYGVPPQALLGANGLKSASQVHPGMHVIVPVYNAHGVAANAPAPIPAATELPHKATSTAEATEKKAKSKTEAAEADDTDKKAAKAKAKAKTADSESDQPAKAKDKKSKAESADATDTKAKDKKAKTEVRRSC